MPATRMEAATALQVQLGASQGIPANRVHVIQCGSCVHHQHIHTSEPWCHQVAMAPSECLFVCCVASQHIQACNWSVPASMDLCLSSMTSRGHPVEHERSAHTHTHVCEHMPWPHIWPSRRRLAGSPGQRARRGHPWLCPRRLWPWR